MQKLQQVLCYTIYWQCVICLLGNLSECQDVNDAWLNFTTSFSHVADNLAPQIENKVHGRNTPWLSNKLKKVMAERDHFYHQARTTNTELH